MRHPLAWLRARLTLADRALADRALADWALAALLTAFSASQDAAVLLLSAGLAGCVAARRRFPASACWIATGLGAIQVGLDWRPVMADLAIALTLYTLAATRPRGSSGPALAAGLVLAAVAVLKWGGTYPGPLDALTAGVIGLVAAAWLLGDSARRNRQLQQRRARAVEQSAARLRQIERDLHDGAQIRLAALAMMIGEVKESLDEPAGPDLNRLRQLVGEAHGAARETMSELRDLAHGIHPPALDRGLSAALAALAEASVIPVAVTAPAMTGLPPPIEAMAYFCAAELLANAAKHSGADQVSVTVGRSEGRLSLMMSDNGRGGATIVPGGGLAGLRARVQTVDGRMIVESPPGGPTTVTIQLPEHV